MSSARDTTDDKSIFLKIFNKLDENVRIVQYAVYGIGGAGLVIALYSIKAFSKIKRIEQVPKEFIRNHSKCRGTVKKVSVDEVVIPVLPSAKDSKVPQSRFQKIFQYYNKSYFYDHNRNISENFDEKRLYNVYLHVEHIPTFQIFPKRSVSKDETLRLKLSTVEVLEEYIESVKISLDNHDVWFTILCHDKQAEALDSIIKRTEIASSLNEELVAHGQAIVSPFVNDLSKSKYYQKFYRKLLKSERLAQKRGVGLWHGNGRKWWQLWK